VLVRVLVLVLSFGLGGVGVVGSLWGSKLFLSIFVELSRSVLVACLVQFGILRARHEGVCFVAVLLRRLGRASVGRVNVGVHMRGIN
jgi:hypothetical protein